MTPSLTDRRRQKHRPMGARAETPRGFAVVSRARLAVHARLRTAFTEASLTVIRDRRARERRDRPQFLATERRVVPAVTWGTLGFVLVDPLRLGDARRGEGADL